MGRVGGRRVGVGCVMTYINQQTLMQDFDYPFICQIKTCDKTIIYTARFVLISQVPVQGFSTYVTIVVPEGEQNFIQVDNTLFIDFNWQPIPDSVPPMVTTLLTLTSGNLFREY